MSPDKKAKMNTRPPVVVILGHIDHGKSSLLEAIKDFSITKKESGGITQHIAAYQVDEKGKKITFLDTPGHEAFSKMRSRGAQIADIAILVVDAVEGIKPQTKEVISNIKELGLKMIVALNKVDKPEADPERIKRELSKEDISVEGYGGSVPSVKVSAKQKTGIEELLEMILLVAEMEDLKADNSKTAEGVVIESFLDKNRGATATLLVKEGVLNNGDVIATPSAFCKVKNLEDFQKKTIKKAYPSDPVVVFGFSKAPNVGDSFKIFPNTEEAQDFVKNFNEQSFENVDISEGQKPLKIILKADVIGSLEAIEGMLSTLPQDKIVLNILRKEVGMVNESDAKLALSSKAIIVAFRVKADTVSQKIIERENLKTVSFDVIYELVGSVKNYMERMLGTEEVKKEVGRLKVLAHFLSDKNRQIIGGRVAEGEIKKGLQIEVLREDEFLGKGKMINLQRNKKDANVVLRGDECGILFEGDVKIEQGDTLVFYTQERVKGVL